MEFFDVIAARHSVRAYADRLIETEKLNSVLESVNRAPSAGNLQAYEIYLVQDKAKQMEIAAVAYAQEFLVQAPLLLVFCAHADRSAERYGKRGISLYCLQDATIACTFAMLSAQAMGLSTVWVGAFNEGEVSRIINAPQAHRPVAILPIGYADGEPRVRERRPLSEIIHRVA